MPAAPEVPVGSWLLLLSGWCAWRLPGAVLCSGQWGEAAQDTLAFWAKVRPLALPLTSPWLWVGRVPSLTLSFLICKMGIRNTHPLHQTT